MNITANSVVSLEVTLSDIWGNLLERSTEPLQYLHGGYGDIFPAVEAALEGKREKDSIEVRLEPEDAFGDYDEQLLRMLDRASLPREIEVGMRVEGEPGGEGEGLIFTITDIAEDKVVVDANHPLSGMALNYACTVVAVRPATADEIANGSADDISSVVIRAVP